MITKDEIQELLHSTETYRVERTTSTGDMDKFQEAICAFANDLPNSRKNGYLILGAYDNGELSGLKGTDDLLKKIAAIRSNGNILPIPVMSVDRFQFPEGDLLVAEVSPSDLPPVRAIVVALLYVSGHVETSLRRQKSASLLSEECHSWPPSTPCLVWLPN